MPDLKKVIKGLECCSREVPEVCERMSCPYANEHRKRGKIETSCMDHLMRDALTLLKAREPDEDWISRKRLRDEIQYYIEEAGWGDEVNKVLVWCLEFIGNQEAVKWE